MYCNNCNQEYKDDMNFCPFCGTANPNAVNYNQQYYQPAEDRQNYQNGQYNPYQQPYSQQYNAPNPKDVPSAGFNVLAFFFPIVGLILYLVWKDETPKKAKAIGKWALISVIVNVVVYIIAMIAFFAIFAVAGVSTYPYMM